VAIQGQAHERGPARCAHPKKEAETHRTPATIRGGVVEHEQVAKTRDGCWGSGGFFFSFFEMRFLIRDRGGQFTTSSRRVRGLGPEGPAKSAKGKPRAKAILRAHDWDLRREVLDHLWSERGATACRDG